MDSYIKENKVVFNSSDLTITFGGLKALDGLNFHLFKGETLGLIGPNGSGKTTLFNVMTGIYKPTLGSFFFKGENLTGMKPYQIARKGIARTFQKTRLCLNLSVLDNIIAGFHHHLKISFFTPVLRSSRFITDAKRTAQEATELLNIFSKDLPDRLFTPVGELSLIDRRRVEICRALAARMSLLLLDEPSAGMNPEETGELMDDICKFRSMNPDISVIIIEHDMNVIRTISDRVMALSYGRKIVEGTYQEVSQNKEVKEAYMGKEE